LGKTKRIYRSKVNIQKIINWEPIVAYNQNEMIISVGRDSRYVITKGATEVSATLQ